MFTLFEHICTQYRKKINYILYSLKVVIITIAFIYNILHIQFVIFHYFCIWVIMRGNAIFQGHNFQNWVRKNSVMRSLAISPLDNEPPLSLNEQFNSLHKLKTTNVAMLTSKWKGRKDILILLCEGSDRTKISGYSSQMNMEGMATLNKLLTACALWI